MGVTVICRVWKFIEHQRRINLGLLFMAPAKETK